MGLELYAGLVGARDGKEWPGGPSVDPRTIWYSTVWFAMRL